MAWTDLDFVFEQVLTTTEMDQLQANFAAMAAGDAGAPAIAVATGDFAIGGDLNFSGVAPEIYGNDIDQTITLNAGNSGARGSNIVLYAGSHASKANDIEFRNGGTVRGGYDSSGAVWAFSKPLSSSVFHADADANTKLNFATSNEIGLHAGGIRTTTIAATQIEFKVAVSIGTATVHSGAGLDIDSASGGIARLWRNEAAIGVGDSLGQVVFAGSEDGGSTINDGASIVALGAQNHSGIASGSDLIFSTTPISSTTLTLALTLGSDQVASFVGDILTVEDGKFGDPTLEGYWMPRSDNLGVTSNSAALVSSNDIVFSAQSNGAGTGVMYWGAGGTDPNDGGWTEKMRLTSGTLLIGKTASGDYVTGIELQPNGAVLSYRTTQVAGIFGRTDAGEILRLTTNSAVIGGLGSGVGGTELYLDGSAATGKTGIQFGGAAWYPRDGGVLDTTRIVSLGSDTYRMDKGYFDDDVFAERFAGIDDTNTYIEIITGDLMKFVAGGSEYFRITGGDFMVGKTATSFSGDGVEIDIATGITTIVTTGATSLAINQQSGASAMIELYYAGTEILSIAETGTNDVQIVNQTGTIVIGAGVMTIGNGVTGGVTLTNNLTLSDGNLSVTNDLTTTNTLDVVNNSLTSAKLAYFYSNSSSATARFLVNIHNDHVSATGVTALYVRNDSTGDAITAVGNVNINGGLTMSLNDQTFSMSGSTCDYTVHNTATGIEIGTPNGQSLFFQTNAATGLTLTAAQVILIGDKAGLTDVGVGAAFAQSGLSYITRDAGLVLSIARTGSDGDMVRFVNDSTAVGYMGSIGNQIALKSSGSGSVAINRDVDDPTYIYREHATSTVGVLSILSNYGGTDSTNLTIAADGDVVNTNGSYGTISDRRLKEDFSDVRSYWDSFKALNYQNYSFKSNGSRQIGLIAQEVQEIFPALVRAREDGMLTIKTSVIDGTIGSIVLQEAMVKIEALEIIASANDNWKGVSVINEKLNSVEGRVETLEKEVKDLREQLAKVA